jgi:coenzyme PQQ precursor peptide PqqA
METQMANATALKPSAPKPLPPPNSDFCHFVEALNADKWSTPRIVEIAVGLEINAHAIAELNCPRSTS